MAKYWNFKSLRRTAYGTRRDLGKLKRTAFLVFVLRQKHLSFFLGTDIEFAPLLTISSCASLLPSPTAIGSRIFLPSVPWMKLTFGNRSEALTSRPFFLESHFYLNCAVSMISLLAEDFSATTAISSAKYLAGRWCLLCEARMRKVYRRVLVESTLRNESNGEGKQNGQNSG